MITQPDDYARQAEEYAAAVDAHAQVVLREIGKHVEPAPCQECGRSASACGRSGSFCCTSCAGEPGVLGTSFRTHRQRTSPDMGGLQR